MRMRIAYCTSGLESNDRVKLVLEHCTRLLERDHDVTIINPSGHSPALWGWCGGALDVPVIQTAQMQDNQFDVVVATDYPSMYWAHRFRAKKHFYLVQMMEYLPFRRTTSEYYSARQSYSLAAQQGVQVITTANWLRKELRMTFGVDATVLPVGVDREQFYPDGEKQDYILVGDDSEGLIGDVDDITWETAEFLRQKYGLPIYGYSVYGRTYNRGADDFFVEPNTRQMRQLYSEAAFLLRANRYDGRALDPIEAMCCGTPTVRGIIRGDDDLVYGKNCLRSEYSPRGVIEQAERMVEDEALRRKLERGCKKYAKKHLNWDPIIDKLEEIYGI